MRGALCLLALAMIGGPASAQSVVPGANPQVD